MSGRGEELSKGLGRQIEGGLLGDTLGPLSGRVEGGQPPLEPEGPGAETDDAASVGAEEDSEPTAVEPGDTDGFVGMGPGVDYSSSGSPYA